MALILLGLNRIDVPPLQRRSEVWDQHLTDVQRALLTGEIPCPLASGSFRGGNLAPEWRSLRFKGRSWTKTLAPVDLAENRGVWRGLATA